MNKFILFIIINLLTVSCITEAGTDKIFDLNIKKQYNVKYEMRDGIKCYQINSIVKFDKKNPIGKESEHLKIFTINNKYRLFVFYAPLVFMLLTDLKNNYLNVFSNGKDISEWAKITTGITDNNAWIVKYTLGYSFISLKVKGDRIYLLTNDGGTGSMGGFTIEHVFKITNDKPVTLVSKFIENPEKEKRAREFDKMVQGIKTFTGTINSKYKIEMDWKNTNNTIIGQYYYLRIKKPIKIEGKIIERKDDFNKILIYEFDKTGKKVAVFDGEEVSPGYYEGIWKTLDNKKQYPFEIENTTFLSE